MASNLDLLLHLLNLSSTERFESIHNYSVWAYIDSNEILRFAILAYICFTLIIYISNPMYYLKGTYINHSQKGCRCNLIILDISVTGLAFSCVDAPTFKVGNEHQTEIRRDGIVGNIRPGVVGAEFEISAESAFDGPLGYYVMS